MATNNDTVKVFGQSPLRSSGPLAGGPLCVQNLLSGGSFEEDGTHWALILTEYKRITSGSCATYGYGSIEDRDECEAAAVALGLGDGGGTYGELGYAGDWTARKVPRCFYLTSDSKVRYITTDSKVGNASSSYQGVCKTTTSHLADIETAAPHVGEKALRLQTSTVVARHLPAKTYATHQHRVRFWARMVGATTQVASTNDRCGQLSVIFSNASSTTTTAPLTHPVAFQTNVAIACRPDRSWQYKEAWIPSYGQDGNITVEVRLMDTTGNYTLLVDDVSVVPFPGDQPVTFWSGTNLNNRCDSRQPLSGIVGHVNGAREENQYCEMHLDSGGWELFAMDGIGDKDQHRATLATGHPDGVGVVSSGKGNLVSLIVPPPPPPPPSPPPHQRCFDYSNPLWWPYAGYLWNSCWSLSITGPGTDLGFSFFFFFFFFFFFQAPLRHCPPRRCSNKKTITFLGGWAAKPGKCSS